MYIYKDFKYVQYIINLEFDEGYDLYQLCIKRINDETIKREDDKLWLAFINSGFEGTFEDFKKQLQRKSNITHIDDRDRDNDINRIIKDSEDLRKKMQEQDKLENLNKIMNEVIM